MLLPKWRDGTTVTSWGNYGLLDYASAASGWFPLRWRPVAGEGEPSPSRGKGAPPPHGRDATLALRHLGHASAAARNGCAANGAGSRAAGAARPPWGAELTWRLAVAARQQAGSPPLLAWHGRGESHRRWARWV